MARAILSEVTAVFVAAFPERLRRGGKPEPAFLIPKTFSTEQVRSAMRQATIPSSAGTLAP